MYTVWFLADAQLANYLFLLGMVLITSVMLRRVYRRMRKNSPRRSARHTAAGTALARQQSLDGPRQMQQWQVEMYEIERELSARLDSKIVAVEQLLITAERERRRLESLLGQSEPRPPSDNVPHAPESPAEGLLTEPVPVLSPKKKEKGKGKGKGKGKKVKPTELPFPLAEPPSPAVADFSPLNDPPTATP